MEEKELLERYKLLGTPKALDVLETYDGLGRADQIRKAFDDTKELVRNLEKHNNKLQSLGLSNWKGLDDFLTALEKHDVNLLSFDEKDLSKGFLPKLLKLFEIHGKNLDVKLAVYTHLLENNSEFKEQASSLEKTLLDNPLLTSK